MDNGTLSELNKPVNEGKIKNSAKRSDDELILRRKRQNAERVRAYRERIKALAKLDGVNKPLRKSHSMEEYLQLESEWQPPESTKSGKKRVRWADLEEQREQAKMRRIGFVVGHTNWNRMMDPTGGSSALTQTKYI